MNVSTEAGALFDNDPRHKVMELLLDLTIVHLCLSINLVNAARRAENILPTKSSEIKVSALIFIYLLLPFCSCVDVW